jgi:hypothetical protein
MLDRRYSPEQASGRLKVLYPDDPQMRVSHETTCQSIYVYPRGELHRDLRACLRTGRAVRRRRGGRETRGGIVDAVPIGQRPAEIEGRLVPAHHEGDLIIGSRASNSAVGTIVERVTGYLTLLPLRGGRDPASVADAIIAHMSALPRDSRAPSPGTAAARPPSTSESPPPPPSRCTSPTPTRPGNGSPRTGRSAHRRPRGRRSGHARRVGGPELPELSGTQRLACHSR